MLDENGKRLKDAGMRSAGGRWLPGKSANPAGRPTTDKCVNEWVRKFAGEASDIEGLSWAQAVALSVYRAAVHDADMRAASLILARLEPAVNITQDATPSLSRDELLEHVAANSRGALLRWATADGLILEN